MKKALIVFIVALSILTGYGCMKKSDNKINFTQQKMIDYMTDKYNESFSFISVYGGNPGTDVHKILVSSESYPEKEICVVYDSFNDFYSDNYLGIKYEDETREYLKRILSGCFDGEVFVHYNADNLAMTENGNKNTTFNEYISSVQSGITFTAIVSTKRTSDENDLLMNNLQKALAEAGICCNGSIYFASDDFDIGYLTDETYYNEYIFPQKYIKKLFFIMSDDMEIFEHKWE